MKALPSTIAQQALATNTAASGAASIITLTPESGGYVVLNWLIWSYKIDPIDGLLTIAATGMDTLPAYITVGGPGEMMFSDSGLVGPKDAVMTITLADGTADKHLTVQYR